MRSMFGLYAILCFFSACSTPSNSPQPESSNPREYQVGAYLWQQTSGEYRALTYQAYNLARTLIERDLENKHNKKRAVIFDIDETILDNSYGGARDIKNNLIWNAGLFADWVKLKQAMAIPGALDFIKFLKQNQIEVFYISNRNVAMFEDTLVNLRAQGFPVKKENLLLKDETSDKGPRRELVQKNHEIVLFIGDNLTDFPGGFEKKSVGERNALVDIMKADFGVRFIVLPNPLYGDWENALPKDRPRIELLKLDP